MQIHAIFKLGAIALALLAGGSSWAGVSAAEADKLKSELTPFGAEKAANKDGSIPAWTGGLTTVAPGYKGGPRPDPFAADKALYTVDASNMAQHLDKLSDGQQAMLKKYPSYKINVYATHRTAAAPQWVYDNTFKNATRAKTANDGNSLEGAYGGIPFPIPKTGKEAMWNHLVRWGGEACLYVPSTWIVSGGKVALSATTRNEQNYPYYYKDGSPETFKGEYWYDYQVTSDPSYKAGETILVRDSVDGANPRQAWQYLVGQRRVRKAPNLAYDTPDPVTSGIDFMDEVMLFLGALDRFDYKLVGKKEMLIPYNLNGFMNRKASEVLGPEHLNHLRWELHRVWVVEATVAAGKRHTMPKRRYYLDEDTWGASLYDGWDAQGQLWHSGLALPIVAPEFPAVIYQYFAMADLLKGSYQATIGNDQSTHYEKVPPYPESNFTPEYAASRGVR
jgi:hypothetical protein